MLLVIAARIAHLRFTLPLLRDRFSVNLIAWLGADCALLQDFGEDDERKLTERPKSMGRC